MNMHSLVLAGVTYLDVHGPTTGEYWRDRIDHDRLNMSSMTACVLGQIYGHYDAGLHILNLNRTDASKLGFYLILNDFDSTAELIQAYAMLNAAWKAWLTA
jgi:hypothetical protein